MKKLIIILILITILAVLVTATMIVIAKTNSFENNKNVDYAVNDNSNVERKKVQLYKNYHQNIQDDIKGVELDEIFYENPITFKKCIYEVDDIQGEYYQISGLKDKQVENNINNQLKESFIYFVNENKQYFIEELLRAKRDGGFLDEYFDERDSKYSAYVLRQEILSNFGNVISCANYFNAYPCYFARNFSSWDQYEVSLFNPNHEFININLNDGNELKFEELFTSDADLLRLISNAYHNTIRGEFYTYNWDYEEDPTLPMLIDNSDEISPEGAELEIENIIKIFKNNEHTNFGFTPARLFLVINGRNAEISLKDNNKFVAIYKRFINNNIFEKNTSSNPVKVFLDVTYDNSLLFSNIDGDNEYYIYDTIKSGQINNKDIVIEYVNELISKEKEKLSNKKGPLFVQVYNLDKNNLCSEFKGKVNPNIDLYVIPSFSINEYGYQDALKQSGAFQFGYVNYYDSIETIFGILDGKIIKKEDLNKYLFNDDGNYEINTMLEADGRILTLNLKDMNNEDVYNRFKAVYCVITRSLQYTNIQNFTGVT